MQSLITGLRGHETNKILVCDSVIAHNAEHNYRNERHIQRQ